MNWAELIQQSLVNGLVGSVGAITALFIFAVIRSYL